MSGTITAAVLAAQMALLASIALPEPPIADGWYEEPAYYEPAPYTATYEPEAYTGGTAADFQWQGVVQGDGVTFTWYSENVLPGGGLDALNANGRHLDADGFVVDGDGYIAVASSDLAMGTVVETPWGEAKVYDTGCAPGVVDVYVGW